MSTKIEAKLPAKATGRRYSSVADLLNGECVSPEVKSKYAEMANETKVTEQLAMLRHRAGITQEEIAGMLGMTQSAVSKIESGSDDDVTLAIIREYSRATKQRVGLVFGKPMNHVESVKAHAVGIKKHLSALAGLAHQDEELEREISAFFGEAFFNLLDILSKCHGEMPNGKEFEMKFDALEQEKAKPALKKTASLKAAELITA